MKKSASYSWLNIFLFFSCIYANKYRHVLESPAVDSKYSSGYFKGYIDALSETTVSFVECINGNIFVTSKNGNAFISKIAEVVQNISPESKVYKVHHTHYKENSGIDSMVSFWFPKTCLFEPLIADPRQVSKGVTYRFDDDVFGRRVAQVNFSGESPILRLEFESLSYQIGVDGGVFALFNMGEPSHGHVADLQNADYYGGLNLQCRYKDISVRVRFYHISCHIGDDFIGSLISFPGERDKQILWKEKLNFIKATQSPYTQQIISLLNNESAESLKHLNEIQNPMPDKITDELIQDYSKAKTLVSAYCDWPFSNKPSYEVIDVAMSYQLSIYLRIYTCLGIIIRNNPSIDQGKGYLQVGVEAILSPKKILNGLYARFIYCVHIIYADMYCWIPDVTHVYGVDLSNSSLFGKRLRIYFETHSGYSQEGMFRRGRASYVNLGIKYFY